MTAIDNIPLPEGLHSALSNPWLDKPALAATSIALGLSAIVHSPQLWIDEPEKAFRAIGLGAASIRQAALQVGLDLPVVVVLDLAGSATSPESCTLFRALFDCWASDQDWHRGEFALYLCPVVVPTTSGERDWTGPDDRDAMVRHLLGAGTLDWHLEPMERPTAGSVARQLETWAEQHELDRSDPHGDLLHCIARALRELARASTAGTERTAAATSTLENVVDDWAARHLAAPESRTTADGDGP